MKRTGWAVSTSIVVAAAAVIAYTVASAWPFVDEHDYPTFAPLLERVRPAVVNVAVVSAAPPTQGNPLLEDPFFRRFFELPDDFEFQQPLPQQGVGSGVIIDADRGLIVSNSHVVQNADDIVVTLTDRRQFNAEVVGSDPATDVALLRIEADNLSEIPFGDSDDLDVGDFVLAIGNPFGIGQTATAGIVSALGRSGINIEGYEDFIQTDASINPGNSGGALVGLDGTLKGINTAILSPAGGNVGIGFAIPSNMVQRVVGQLLEFGEVRRGRIGIGIQDVTPALDEALGLGIDRGALVSEVEPGSPAEAAGIEVGDVVVAVNGDPVETSTELRNAIGLMRLGETVTLTLIRDGDTRELEVRVSPAEDSAQAAEPGDRGEANRVQALEGAELMTLGPGDPRFTGRAGVIVTNVRPGSRAARNGLRPNDIIFGVNRMDVATVEELRSALESITGAIALRVEREGRQLFLTIQ